MKGYIYQIENLVNHKSYIGQTVDFKRRKNTHLSKLRKGTHENQKLQNAWNKYGELEFHFRYWEFEISNAQELDKLECDYIKKYNSIENGYNIEQGGGKPPNHQKINNEDIISFLCILERYGDGYGKTFESIFNWSHGTASCIKRRIRYHTAIQLFDIMTSSEKEKRAIEIYNLYNLQEEKLKRLESQGGCTKSYQLHLEDYFFAFCAQEMGYGYTTVANFLGVKPATVKDWFNGRSRKKERQQYELLSFEDKQKITSRVKTAELSGNPKL